VILLGVCAKGAMLMEFMLGINQMKFDNIVNSNYGGLGYIKNETETT
jgi:hypothetical protein